MIKDKISVIIILYFSKHLIKGIISNINTTIKDCGEIILINNSREDLTEFETEQTKVIYPPYNLGYGAGINLGVEKAQHEFLLILNPDLVIHKFDINLEDNKRQVILSGHDPKIPGYSLKFPTLFRTFLSHSIIDLTYIRSIDRLVHYKRIKSISEEVFVDYVSGALIFTNKETFNRIGGFDNSFFLFYEETDFCKRAHLLRIPVVYSLRITFEPTKNKASSEDVDGIKIRSGIRSCKNYHYKYNSIIATKCTFGLLKIYYAIIILFLTPFSFISNSIKNKKNNCLERIKFL